MATELSAPAVEADFQLSRGMVFPLVGGRHTWSQEHLLPIIATILVSLGMMVVLHLGAQPTGSDQIQQAWVIYWIIALYIALMINVYIYNMCERAAPWWLFVGVAACTFLLLESQVWHYWYALFNHIIPSLQWRKSPYYGVQLAGWYFVGLCEEGFKALPLFGGPGIRRSPRGRGRADALGLARWPVRCSSHRWGLRRPVLEDSQDSSLTDPRR